MPTLEKSTEPQFLYLTTIGRRTGLLREIEIWFVSFDGKYYVLAEHREKADWVKNIRANPRVHVRVGEQSFEATARVLDKGHDQSTYAQAQQLERGKYGWGAGLPVEIVPS